jgi:lipopolysaccharide transport system ATP-binding protein
MGKPAIRAENLSKRYTIDRKAAYQTARDTVAGALSRWRRRGSGAAASDDVWALSDVCLEVECGAAVGLIGPNGAGKSTLLKILSRITEPTRGRAQIRGRVGSLLEVGTGFHPELSGRENIYFNGALLGMTKREIDRQFDRIVDFAGTERFLDTPVKFYSTGMHARLAFAVAAHLETDILLVDEVLAVGDAAFQRKCLGRMNETAKEGRTVVFVSHDLTNVAVLCQTAVLLDHGMVQAVGSAKSVIERYLNGLGCAQREARWDLHDAPGDATVRITGVRAATERNRPDPVAISQEVLLSIEYTVHEAARLNPVLVIRNAWGVVVFSTANYENPEWGRRIHEAGAYVAQCTIPAHILNSGTYYADALIVKDTRHVLAKAHQAVSIEMHDEGSLRSDYLGEWVGVVRPRCAWETSRVTAGVLVAAQ